MFLCLHSAMLLTIKHKNIGPSVIYAGLGTIQGQKQL